MDKGFRREIILDNYKYPRNHGLISDKLYNEYHAASDSCIDDIYVQIKIINDIIEDVRFDGHACTISTASTSIMTDLVKGKNINEALKLIDNYRMMLEGREYDQSLLFELEAFEELNKQANRINCGLIGVEAIRELIYEYQRRK